MDGLTEAGLGPRRRHRAAGTGDAWDLLRSSSAARDRYEAAKLRLAEEHGNDRKAYTDGKSMVVRSLLSGID